MKDPGSLPLTLYKRWVLRSAVTIEEVEWFVQERIRPAYRLLSAEVDLGLEVAPDACSILAVQRWASRSAYEEVTNGGGYERWWADYEPVLDEWDRLVEFDSEWQTLVLPATRH